MARTSDENWIEMTIPSLDFCCRPVPPVDEIHTAVNLIILITLIYAEK